MYIPGRERQIVELLIERDSAITVGELAYQLDVSVRTIHRDLKNVEAMFKQYQITLIKKASIGLFIEGSTENKEQLRLAMTKAVSNDYTPAERQAIILAALFATKEPIKQFAFANDLKVTIATIRHDLDVLETQLSEFRLTLVRKRGAGVQIRGAEENKRQAISHLMTTYIDPFELIHPYTEGMDNNQGQHNLIKERLLGFVQVDRLKIIEKVVARSKEELPYELADQAYIGLIVHLALAMERLEKGDSIDFDQAYLHQIADKLEYQTAALLIQRLEKELGMEIPEAEIGYITMHLLGAKLRVDPHYVIEESAMDVAFKTKELIQYVNAMLNVHLDQSRALLNDLVAHLKPAIYRMKRDMKITNPIIDEIKNDYGELFQLLKEAVKEVFPKITFPDDEIGYLVLHFGAALFHHTAIKNVRVLVVCASGIGTAKILASQLQQQFPEITDVKNVSMFAMPSINTDEYDLILSTVTLAGMIEPYIVVSPILTEQEKLQIKHHLRKMLVTDWHPEPKKGQENVDYTKRMEELHRYTSIILSLLEALKVTTWKETASIHTMLRDICKDLKAGSYLHNNDVVYEKLIQREKQGGMGLPQSTIALYHTRTNEVRQPCFMIYRMQQPIHAKGMQGNIQELDTILIMLAPEDVEQEVLEVLSFISSLLVQHKRSLPLFKTGKKAEVKQFISKQLFRFLESKNKL